MFTSEPPNGAATCPVRTLGCLSPGEVETGVSCQIRAYKLGKRRWSYNQCELLLLLEDSSSRSKQSLPVTVSEAVLIKEMETEANCIDGNDASTHPDSSPSHISYRVRLENGSNVVVALYLVYPEPSSILAQEGCGLSAQAAEYSWSLVTRGHCKKGCTGRLLHPLRRFGALGCRFNGGGTGKTDSSGSKQTKQSKYMYFAIDEAGTHVGSETFRLIAAVHDETGTKLLGTACSQPIRVVANNDIPMGAAHISLVATIRGRLAAQQVHSLREPTSKTAALWSDTRLQQTFCNSEGRTPVCYPAGLAPAAVGPKAAEPPPVESGICGKRARTAMHRLRPMTAVADSSLGVKRNNASVPCTGKASNTTVDHSVADPYTQQHDELASQDSEDAHSQPAGQIAGFSKHATANSNSCADEKIRREHEPRVDTAGTLRWQSEGRAMSGSPLSPRTSHPPGTKRLSCLAINCNQSFLEDYSDLINQGGPTPTWDGALNAQPYFGGDSSPIDEAVSEPLASRSWPSQNYHSIRPATDDGRSPNTLELDGSPCKRIHTMRPANGCTVTVRSYSSPSHTGQNHPPTPWRKSLQRGFLFPSATSCPKVVGRSPSAAYVPTEAKASFRALQATVIAQLEEEMEKQSNELRQQKATNRMLQAELGSNKQEIQWLRDRVRQLQKGQYIRHSIAARPATSQSPPAQPNTLFLPDP